MLMQNADGRRLEVGNEYLRPQTFQFGPARGLKPKGPIEAMPRH